MSWDRVIGQERVKELLRRALTAGQVAHAYLLFGDEGVGKDALALEFASALNCEKKSTDACGECDSCRRMDTLHHPNVRVVVALPAGKGEKTGDDPVSVLTDDQVAGLRQELAAKAKDPYHRVTLPKANFIKVNSIRELRREAALTGFLGGKKVFILSQADRMNTEASNSLLKTLEEPPGDTLIILTTARKEQLLPTIISRCQLIRCEPLGEDEIAEALVERDGRTETEARVAAQLSNGSFVAARSLVSEDMVRIRTEVAEFLRGALGKSPVALLTEIEQTLASADRIAAERWLRMLQVWFHDAVAMREQIPSKAGDENEDLKKFIHRFPEADFLRASGAVERSIALIGKNVYISLVFISLAIDLKKILYSPSVISLEKSATP